MYPVICRIGPFTLYSYGLMFAFASLVCLFFVVKEGKTKGIQSTIFFDIFFWTLISAIVGARLLYILTNLNLYLAEPKEILNIHHGGQSWFGGFVFGMLAAIIFIRRKGLSFFYIADIFAPYLALAQGIGRIGCFLNGCCYGRLSNSIFAIESFSHSGARHPTQLYAFFNLILIFVLLSAYKKRRKEIIPGEVFCLYLILYGINRFIVEFFRADTISTPILTLSLFQIFSIIWILSAVIAYLILKTKHYNGKARV
ncbi:MAG: prolipoprotein diacylglyceryl transferase [Candidatus Omnitrophica bacterium]|nr:prolipoprotein diacylglyceryl transferase [Candidatus Omnitrophota bacterium]